MMRNKAVQDHFLAFVLIETPLNCLIKSVLFIVRADLASGRDFHLEAERAELSDFEFYCIFE